jgi:putative transcriptional regulator
MTTRYELKIHGRRLLDTPYHLKGIGLPNVFLLNGVTMEDDADYGPLVTIEQIHNLHRVLGLSIVRQPQQLNGEEMRFLRKQIGLTQVQLATKLGVSQQTVANYEKGKTEKGPADIALRFIYLAHVSPNADLADDCRQIAAELAEVSEQSHTTKTRLRAGQWSGGQNENHVR